MTYNLMTVFGLILAVGLLVDGPIVITEFARAEQERGVRGGTLILIHLTQCFGLL